MFRGYNCFHLIKIMPISYAVASLDKQIIS